MTSDAIDLLYKQSEFCLNGNGNVKPDFAVFSHCDDVSHLTAAQQLQG